MKENYTPSEQLEAADKAKQHEKGREQARFYRVFLNAFEENILHNIESINKYKIEDKKIDDVTSTEPLKNIYKDNGLVLEESSAIKKAKEVTGIDIKDVKVDLNQIGEMTLSEFKKYIEDLKSSLIQE